VGYQDSSEFEIDGFNRRFLTWFSEPWNVASKVSQPPKVCMCNFGSSGCVRRSGVQSLAVAGVTQQDGFLVASPAQGC
jgi:hypothetical protein